MFSRPGLLLSCGISYPLAYCLNLLGPIKTVAWIVWALRILDLKTVLFSLVSFSEGTP